MKWLAIVALALLTLIVPSAQAVTGSKEMFTASQDESMVVVTHVMQFRVEPQENYTLRLSTYGARDLNVTVDNQTRRLDAPCEVQGEVGGRSTCPVNGTISPGPHEVRIAYWIPADKVRFSSIHAGSLTIFARAKPGFVATSPDVNLAGTGGNWHGGIPQAMAGQVITIQFEDATPPTTTDQTKWVWAAGGVLVGVVLVWIAVRQGWVSAPGKAKRFVKGGTMESTATLEARRRTLMAALKDLEHAHDAKEVPDEVYFPLKEEYKQQAVRVMRTLEEKKEG